MQSPANILQIVRTEGFWIVGESSGKLLKLVIAENKLDFMLEILH